MEVILLSYTQSPIKDRKDFEAIANDVNENFNNIKAYMDNTLSPVVGYYIGNIEDARDDNGNRENYSISRTIHLGFTPVAVSVYSVDGYIAEYFDGGGEYKYREATCLIGNPCFINGSLSIKIKEGGFSVLQRLIIGRESIALNKSNKKYLFIAYKSDNPDYQIEEYK